MRKYSKSKMFSRAYRKTNHRILKLRSKELSFFRVWECVFLYIGKIVLYGLVQIIHHPTRSFEVAARQRNDGTWMVSYVKHIGFVQRLRRMTLSGVAFIAIVAASAFFMNVFFFDSAFIRGATYTFTVPDDVDWGGAGATLSNVLQSGTDLVLNNTDMQKIDTSSAGWSDDTASHSIDASGTELKLQSQTGANYTSGSGLNTGSNTINDVFDDGTNFYIATAGGLDVITKSTNTSKGYVTHSGGYSSVWSDGTTVYAGDSDGGVFSYSVAVISGSTSEGTAAYLTTTSPAIVNNNVNDLYGAMIGSDLHLGVATNGGVTIIDVTNSTAFDSSETSAYEEVFLTSDGEMYYRSSSENGLQRRDSVQGISADGFSQTVKYDTVSNPALRVVDINGIYVTNDTSTVEADSNTIFVGHSEGVDIIQEDRLTQGNGTRISVINEGNLGSSGWTPATFGSSAQFDGVNNAQYGEIADDTDMDFTGDMTIDLYFNPDVAISADSQVTDTPLFQKGEQVNAYIDHTTGKLNVELGNTAALTNPALDTVYDDMYHAYPFKDYLYVGSGDDDTQGYVYVCNPTAAGNPDACDNAADWSSHIPTGATNYNGFPTFKDFNGYLYVTSSGGWNEADVFVCDDIDNVSGGAGVCDHADDWVKSYDGDGLKTVLYDLEVYNGRLYTSSGQYWDGDHGYVYRCDPADNGDTSLCDAADWSTSRTGTTDAMEELEAFNGYLYAGARGEVPASEGDIFICDPAGGANNTVECEDDDWSTSLDLTGYEVVSGLATYHNRLYAGAGHDAGDADIYMCNPATAGNINKCDDATDWAKVFDADGKVEQIVAFQDTLYAIFSGKDIRACNPTVAGDGEHCDNASDWVSLTLPDLSGYDTIKGLGWFRGELYYGMGDGRWGQTDRGDLFSYGNAQSLQSTTASWAANTWYLLSIVYDSTNDVARLFINGTQEDSQSSLDITLDDTGYRLWIGRMNHNEDETYFDGHIDEFRMSDTAEYTANFSVPATQFSMPGGATKGFLHHMNEGSGSSSSDSSSLANTISWSGNLLLNQLLKGTEDKVTDIFGASTGARAWIATNNDSADDGSVTQLNDTNTATPDQGGGWRASGTTPTIVDNDVVSIHGVNNSGNVAELIVGTDAGATRFYPGVAPSGDLVSSVQDFGTANTEWGNLTYNATLGGETGTVKVRSDSNSDMSGATAWGSCTTISSGTDMTDNSCVTDGHQYLQYRVDFSTTDAAVNPQIEDITLNTSKLFGTWTYDYDASSPAGWVNLSYAETIPANTDVKFRFATSSNGLTYSAWSAYFTDPNSNDLSSLAESQYLRIQAYLETTSDGASPTLDTFTVTRSQNGPPEVQNVSASQDALGLVNISFQARDADSSSGTANPNQAAASFEYWNGTSWAAATTTTGEGLQTMDETSFTTFTGTWTPATDFANQYMNGTAKIRVTIDDNELLNNSVSAESPTFTLDTANPSAGGTPISINSAATKVNGLNVTLQLSASDNSSLTSAYSNDGTTFGTVQSSDGTITNSGAYEAYSTTKAWTLASGADGARTVYVKFKDEKGNEIGSYSDTIILDSTATDIPSSLDVDDVSDIGAERFRLALNWTPVAAEDNTDFDHYKLEMSTDGLTYVSEATFNDIAEDNYIDKNLTQNQIYYYRIRTVDNAENESDPSSVVADTPGDDDTTAPSVSGDAPTAVCTSASCTVSWTTSESAKTCVEYGATTNYGSIECDLTFATSHSIVISRLTSQTTYHFRARSEDASGNEAVTDDYTWVTSESGDDVIAPLVSSDGAVVTPSDVRATVSWQTNEDSDTFVEFGTTNSLGTLQGDPTMAQDHAITLVGLTPLRVYYYRIRSKDVSGNEYVGEILSFVTTAPLGSNIAPAISGIGTQTEGVSSTSVTITWTTDTASTSKVKYGTSPTALASISTENALLNLSHFITITGLSPNTQYYYQVVSMDAYGNESVSTTQSFKTPRAVVGDPAIEALNITDITLQSAILSWTSNRVSTSRVQYGTTKSYGTTINDSSTDFTTQHAVRLSDLQEGTTYYVQIIGEDEEGDILASDSYVFTTLALPIVSNIEASEISEHSARIAWTTNVAATSVVYFGTDTTYGTSQGESNYTNTHDVVITGLDPNTVYHYQVSSTDTLGNSVSSSDVVLITTQDVNPPVITNIKSEVFSTGAGRKIQANIFWTTDEPSTSQVEYSSGVVIAGSYDLKSQKDESLNISHTMVIPNLEPSRTYRLRVVSEDGAGNVGQSSDRSILTPQAAESVLEEVITSLERTFSWMGHIRRVLNIIP